MMEEVRKHIGSMVKKCLGIFILLVGVLLYVLGGVTSWPSLAIAGQIIVAFGVYIGLVQVLHIKLNPKVAMALNFFWPGLGFAYCRRWYFYLGGAVLFFATMFPEFSWFIILGIIEKAITKSSALTRDMVISALFLDSLLAVSAYFAAKYVKKSEWS